MVVERMDLPIYDGQGSSSIVLNRRRHRQREGTKTLRLEGRGSPIGNAFILEDGRP